MIEYNDVVFDTLFFALFFSVGTWLLIKQGMSTFGTPRMLALLAAIASIFLAVTNAVVFFLVNFYSD